jgi:hypothetical protein
MKPRRTRDEHNCTRTDSFGTLRSLWGARDPNESCAVYDGAAPLSSVGAALGAVGVNDGAPGMTPEERAVEAMATAMYEMAPNTKRDEEIVRRMWCHKAQRAWDALGVSWDPWALNDYGFRIRATEENQG